MGIAGALTARVAPFRRCLVGTALAALAAAATPPASAGDEVDYSAPYLTVENGELVTRYPAKEHPAQDGGKTVTEPSGGTANRTAPLGLAAGLGIALAVAVVGWRRAVARRASRRRSPDGPRLRE